MCHKTKSKQMNIFLSFHLLISKTIPFFSFTSSCHHLVFFSLSRFPSFFLHHSLSFIVLSPLLSSSFLPFLKTSYFPLFHICIFFFSSHLFSIPSFISHYFNSFRKFLFFNFFLPILRFSSHLDFFLSFALFFSFSCCGLIFLSGNWQAISD